MPESSLDPKALAERIAAARKAAGKTQEDAAALLGLSRPTYIAIEKGLRPVQPQELVKLAAFFGRTVNELVRSSEPVALEPHLRAAVDQSRPIRRNSSRRSASSSGSSTIIANSNAC